MKRNHWTRVADLLNGLVIFALLFSNFAYGAGAQARNAAGAQADQQLDNAAPVVATPTRTKRPTRTPTPTKGGTKTRAATAAPSVTPTLPISPTESSTILPSPSATDTEAATTTPSVTASATATAPIATDTPTSGPTETVVTDTATPTETATLTEIATGTPTETETATPTATESATGTPTETSTLTATATISPTATATITPTLTPNCIGSVPTNATATSSIASIDAALGGSLFSPDCRVQISIPPHALARSISLRYEAGGPNPGMQQVVGRFTLQALDASGRMVALPSLGREVTVQVHYDPRELGALKENILDIVYWNESAKNWIPYYSKLDLAHHTLSAKTTILAADSGLSSLDDLLPYLPKLEGFQSDLFTGAATAHYPLVVPPGRGGLTPQLNLNYSSSTADYFDSWTQASYVGVGWDLSTGYVTRAWHFYTYNTPDTGLSFFTLVLNGASYDLVPAGDGVYKTSNEQYYTITSSNDNSSDPNNPNPAYWTVTTKDGTVYTFGTSSGNLGDPHRGYWYRRDPTNGGVDPNPEYYQWALASITDTHGNKIQYNYAADMNSVPESCDGHEYTLALYPDTISYNYSQPNGGGTPLTQVKFNYDPDPRKDQVQSYPTTQCGLAPFMSKKLGSVLVSTALQNSTPQPVRQYGFNYNYATVFSGIVYTATNSVGALGLTSVTDTSLTDSSGTLTELTLGYNNSYLSSVTNPLGGSVSYRYSRQDVHLGRDITNTNESLIYQSPFGGLCSGGNCDWFGSNASLHRGADCHGNMALDIKGSPPPPDSWGGYRVYPYQPGGEYFFNADMFGNSGEVWLGVSSTWGGASTEITSTAHIAVNGCTPLGLSTGLFTLPDNAGVLELHIHTTGEVQVKNVSVYRVDVHPNYVTRRTVDDGLGLPNSQVRYNYLYANGRVNDTDTSDAVSDCFPSGCAEFRHAPNTEFRGFEFVTETIKSGNITAKQTEYDFKQDDVFKGQMTAEFERNGDGSKDFRTTINTYDSRPIIDLNGSTGDRSDFTFLTQRKVKTFDPTTQSSKSDVTLYSYDSFGNVSRETDQGDKGSGDYYRYTTLTYTNLAGHIVDKVVQTKTFDATNTQASNAYNQYYADGDIASVNTDDGNGMFTAATYQYDSYGNRTYSTDALTNPTTIVYDTLYNLFPASVTNASNQATATTYDYRFGVPATITDPNNATTIVQYRRFWAQDEGLERRRPAGHESRDASHLLHHRQRAFLHSDCYADGRRRADRCELQFCLWLCRRPRAAGPEADACAGGRECRGLRLPSARHSDDHHQSLPGHHPRAISQPDLHTAAHFTQVRSAGA